MTRDKLKISLSQLTLFENLPDDAVQCLNQVAIVYQLNAGETLIAQGDFAHSVYVVQSGAVRLVEYTDEGKAVSLKVYGTGDIFGLLAISGAYKNRASIEALDESYVVGMRGDDVRQAMLQCPELGLLMTDLLIDHVHHAHDRIRHLAVERAERRLARALLHFHRKFGSVEDGVWVIDAALSQKDIAEFIGSTIETINRILRSWESKAYVQLSRKHVDILNWDALEAIAGESNMYDRVM